MFKKLPEANAKRTFLIYIVFFLFFFFYKKQQLTLPIFFIFQMRNSAVIERQKT